VWSVPLVLVTVILHAYALVVLNRLVSFVLNGHRKKHLVDIVSPSLVGGTALLATVLHALEASLWATAYYLLGGLPDRKSAMLYSLGAMTTAGGTYLRLESPWRLMGSIEALNGWILFGLTTAFLFNVIQEVWSHRNPRT
jgi:hypothetical protein